MNYYCIESKSFTLWEHGFGEIILDVWKRFFNKMYQEFQ